MPEVSRFPGIVIAMYYRDNGPPHFHAMYGGQRASFSVSELRLLELKIRFENDEVRIFDLKEES